MIGQTLLHYEITAKLGEGGMGEVYRGTDSRLGREVAIKVLPEAFVEDPERLARFEREARVLAALEHPNIAGIYGLEEAGGKQLLVMQLAEGRDLAGHLDAGPIPTERAVSIARCAVSFDDWSPPPDPFRPAWSCTTWARTIAAS